MGSGSFRTFQALEDLQDFLPFILLKEPEPMDVVEEALGRIPNYNYDFTQTIMGWFLILATKMTGVQIPSVEYVDEGKMISKDEKEVKSYLQAMLVFGEAMAKEFKWLQFNQYFIVKRMLEDLRFICGEYLGGRFTMEEETKVNVENVKDEN